MLDVEPCLWQAAGAKAQKAVHIFGERLGLLLAAKGDDPTSLAIHTVDASAIYTYIYGILW